MSNPDAKRVTTPLPPWLAAAVLLMLLPFVDKAIHIDDPLFVWTAKQILVSPLDFYGFEVNWYGVRESMAAVNKNPPLVAYYLAAVGGVFGFSEVALHLGMLVPALALAFGIAALAREVGVEPGAAALGAIATPAFAVAASSLMSDVAMLALGIWGLALAVRSIDAGRLAPALAAGALLGLAVLTKYFAIAFLPLVVVYAIATRRVQGPVAGVCGVAIGVIGAYDLLYAGAYGLHPIADVVGYATGTTAPLGGSLPHRLAVGLFFLGGCSIGPALMATRLWTRRELALFVFFGGLVSAGCVYVVSEVTEHFDLAMHEAVFALAGVQWLALGAREVYRERDPLAIVLACWIAGVFVFAAFTNWTTNGRSILPAIPALGILLARGLERHGPVAKPALALGVGTSFALALAVAYGDARLAGSARTAAAALVSQYATPAEPDERFVFQGSWGFQYYMEELGAEKFEIGRHEMNPGDRMVVPGNNTNLVRVPEGRAREPEIETFEKADWVSLLARRRSAGYHASVWGVLPFSFGASVPARYAVYEFDHRWVLRRKTPGAE